MADIKIVFFAIAQPGDSSEIVLGYYRQAHTQKTTENLNHGGFPWFFSFFSCFKI